VSSVSKILPPLSDKDAIKLSITLPLLSASLETAELMSNEKDAEYERMVEQLSSIYFDLASYSINADYDPRSRSAAAACLHAYIVHFAPKVSNDCPVLPLLEKVIIPAVGSVFESLSQKARASERDKYSLLSDFVDCLNLAAVMVSSYRLRSTV
jgi:hypothetical protein